MALISGSSDCSCDNFAAVKLPSALAIASTLTRSPTLGRSPSKSERSVWLVTFIGRVLPSGMVTSMLFTLSALMKRLLLMLLVLLVLSVMFFTEPLNEYAAGELGSVPGLVPGGTTGLV